MIIGITGTLAAGKGTIVEYLEKKGFKHYSVRNLLIEEIKKRGMHVNRDSMVVVANDLREKESPSFIAEELYRKARKENSDVIIESIRAPGEVHSLKNKDEFYLFSVNANQSIRYERASKRGSETDKVSLETFILNEEREMTSTDPTKQNIGACIEMADYRFTNNRSFNDLYIQVDVVLKKIKNGKNKS